MRWHRDNDGLTAHDNCTCNSDGLLDTIAARWAAAYLTDDLLEHVVTKWAAEVES